MNEQKCLEAIRRGESAYGLLLDNAPHLERKFKRLCKSMRDFLADAKKTFPDAQYYTASGGFNLMLGRSHADGRIQTPQSELFALSGKDVHVGDGDF